MVSVETTTRRVLRSLQANTVAPAHAALALHLAESIDGTSSARDLPPLTKELRAVLADIEAMSKATAKTESAVDDLAAKRARRLAAPAPAERPAARE